jgi:hypothetical protein
LHVELLQDGRVVQGAEVAVAEAPVVAVHVAPQRVIGQVTGATNDQELARHHLVHVGVERVVKMCILLGVEAIRTEFHPLQRLGLEQGTEAILNVQPEA